MTETPAKPFAQILTGNVADDDAFAGGGHTRTATALADTISQIGTRDGAIGLEGSWGTGKSMVIKLAAKALPKGKYEIFTFDLWRHQTDNFRRLFLEEFVSWLDQRNYLTASEVKDAISRIRDRTQTIGTDRFSLYTWPGLVFLLLLALAPIGYSHLTADGPPLVPGALQVIPDTVFLGLNWPQIITLIVPSVFVLWVVIRAINLMRNPAWQRSDAERSFLYALSETAMIFSNEKKRETTKQNIRDEDPTAFEFYGLFRDLLAKAQKDKRRIVFVLDNIDRLPRDEVRAAWSQIWAVFSPNPSQVRGPAAHVIAVIPYDRGHVLSAFNGSGEGDTLAASGGDPNIDLFEKTFDRVIRVSPPVTSDWKAFLDGRLEEAFGVQISGDKHRDDRYHLYRLLQVSLRDKNLLATPRRIISFVNDVGALWVQWGDTIPIATIGFYVVHREEIEANPTIIANPEAFAQQSRSLPEGSTDHLAALCFNVEPAFSRQVVLDGPITRALISRDSAELRGWKTSIGFETTLYEILEREPIQWAQENASNLSNAAINLEAAELEEGAARICWQRLAGSFDRLALRSKPSTNLKGLCKIVEHLDAHRAFKAAQLLRDYFAPSDDPARRLDPSSWVTEISAVLDALEKAAGKDARVNLQRETKLPEDAGYCVNVAAALDETAYQFSDFDCLARPATVVAAVMQSVIDAPHIARVAIPALRKILEAELDQLAPVATVTVSLLRAPGIVPEVGDGDRLTILAQLVEICWQKIDIRNNIKPAVDDGTLLWHSFSCSEEDDAAEGVWLIITSLGSAEHVPPDPHPQLGSLAEATSWYKNVRTSKDEEQGFVDELSDIVAIRDRFSNWVSIVLASKDDAPLFARVLKAVIEAKHYEIDSNFAWMSDYGQLRDLIGPEIATKMLQKLATEDIDWVDKIKDPAILGLSSELVREISTAPQGQAPSGILEIVDKKLVSLAEKDWRTALTGSTEPVGLLIARLQNAKMLLPAATYGEAIRKHALHICVERVRSEHRDDWPELCKALPDANSKQIAAEILNGLGTTTPTPVGVSHFIEMYRPLATKMPFDKNPEVAVAVFLQKLAIDPTAQGIDFIQERKKDLRQCLGRASSDAVAALGNILNGQLGGGDNVLVGRVRTIRNVLGLDTKQAEDQGPEQSGSD